MCVYDNPGTTHFAFSDELYRDLARLASVQAIKNPPPPAAEAATRVPRLRELIGDDAIVGVSGDPLAAASLLAAAPAWFSVIGGLLPEAGSRSRAARAGDEQRALEASERLRGFWELFETFGSASRGGRRRLGLTQTVKLPRPLRPLEDAGQARLEQVLERLGLDP